MAEIRRFRSEEVIAALLDGLSKEMYYGNPPENVLTWIVLVFSKAVNNMTPEELDHYMGDWMDLTAVKKMIDWSKKYKEP